MQRSNDGEGFYAAVKHSRGVRMEMERRRCFCVAVK